MPAVADRYLIGCSDCNGDCDGSLLGDTEIILLILDIRASSAALARPGWELPGLTDLCTHDQYLTVLVSDAHN